MYVKLYLITFSQGEVNVVQESLPSFLHTAEMLSVQGLTETKDSIPSTPPPEAMQIPKLTKIVPVSLKAAPTGSITIPTSRLNFTTPAVSTTTNKYIEIPQPLIISQSQIKKQKLTTESQSADTMHNSGTVELDFTPVKMEIPDYIIPDPQNDTNNPSDVQIQTDDDEMMEPQEDEDDDGKGYTHEDTYEIIEGHTDDDENRDKSDYDSTIKDNEGIDAVELKPDLSNRILITQTVDGKTQGK